MAKTPGYMPWGHRGIMRQLTLDSGTSVQKKTSFACKNAVSVQLTFCVGFAFRDCKSVYMMMFFFVFHSACFPILCINVVVFHIEHCSYKLLGVVESPYLNCLFPTKCAVEDIKRKAVVLKASKISKNGLAH